MKICTFLGCTAALLLSLTLSVRSFATTERFVGHPDAPTKALESLYLPMTFEQNQGQSPERIRFVGRGMSSTVSFIDNGIELRSGERGRVERIRLSYVDAVAVKPVGEALTGGVANYYLSREVNQGITQVPMYSRVRYPKIYPGVDVVFHGNRDQLEYDFEIAPGSAPDRIALKVEDAEKIEIAPNGELVIHAAREVWKLLRPTAFQVIDGARQLVSARYEITEPGIFKVKVGAYDPSIPLVIDPVVQYAGLFAVSSEISVVGVRADSAGNLLLAGSAPADYPVANGNAGSGLYVTKLNAAGDTILFSTFIQASGGSTVSAVAMDALDNFYMTGTSGGTNFPVSTSVLGTSGGFLMKFATNGTIAYSTLLSGAFPRAIALDIGGNVYLVGSADPTLSTVNAFESVPQCPTCLTTFFAKVNPTATAYLFSSYFYNQSNTQPGASLVNGIGVDAAGNLYLAGQGPAPQLNPWQSGGGLFIARFDPDGKTLTFSSDFGSGSETLSGLAIGTDGTVYLVGTAPNNDYPYTLNAARHPESLPATQHIFATAINPALTGLTYSTYIADGSANSMFLSANNHLFVAGGMGGSFPLLNSVVSDVQTAGGFLVEIDPVGQILKSSRFGGHSTTEIPTAVAADSTGDIYVAGELSPQNGTLDPVLVGRNFRTGLTGGNFGTFFAKIIPVNAPQISLINQIAPFLTLRNAGSADLHISSMTFAVDNAAPGATWGNCGTVVPAGSSCVVSVSTADGGLAGGTLSVTSDAQPAVQTFPVTLLPGQKPNLPIGDLLVFDDSGFFLPLRVVQNFPFRIWNVGTAPSVINLISVSPGATQTNNCGTSLAPRAGCTVQITAQSGNGVNLSVFFDDGPFQIFSFFTPVINETPLLSLQGMSFQTQFVGGVSLPRTVTVTNPQDIPITVAPVLAGDSEFTIAGNNCSASLPAHQNCAVAVQFTPLIDGGRTATLSVGSASVQIGGQGSIRSSVQVSPLQQNFFPTVVHLENEVFPVTLTNALATAVPIVGISFSLPDFTETDDCAGQVPASGSCTVQIKFTPQAVGQRNGTMTVAFSGATTQVLTLTASGVTPFSIPPTTLNFTAAVGGTSAPAGFSVGNRLFVPEAYTFTVAGPFAFAQNPCPSPMPPNGTTGCFPTFVFQPTAPGSPQHGTVTISYAGITEQDVVSLNGTVTSVVASPTQLNFPLTQIPSSSTLDVTLANSGANAIGITGIAIPAPYSETDVCQGQVPAAGSCILHIAFTPQSVTFAVTGSLNITLADGAQYAVGLTGIGTGPVISINTSNVAFPDQVIGTTSNNPAAVTIVNNGDQPLTFASISMSSGDFTQTNNCPASLVSTCQITVKFTPTATGLRSGALTITDNGFGSAQTIQFRGTGTDFQAAVAASSVKVSAGQTATYNLSFAAVGTFAGQLSVTCSGAPQLANCGLSSPTINLIGSVPVPLTVIVSTSPHTNAVLFPGQRYLAGTHTPGLPTKVITVLLGLIMLGLAVGMTTVNLAKVKPPFHSIHAQQLLVVKAALAVTCIVLISAVVSCGGSGAASSTPTPVTTPTPTPTQGGTPAGTYTIVVTATDPTINGNISHTTNLTLVVQ